MRRELLPLADLVTPNVPEAEALTGLHIGSVEDMQRAARQIADLGAQGRAGEGRAPSGAATDVLCPEAG
jgi:hydroxymethylpyrimidine/phosphomethylpyrimidine kinase